MYWQENIIAKTITLIFSIILITVRDELHGLFKILKYIFKLAKRDWAVIVSSDQ